MTDDDVLKMLDDIYPSRNTSLGNNVIIFENNNLPIISFVRNGFGFYIKDKKDDYRILNKKEIITILRNFKI